MSDTTPTNVSFTARVMAATRAIESQRSDALFHDPWAAVLAGQESIEATRPRFEADDQQG